VSQRKGEAIDAGSQYPQICYEQLRVFGIGVTINAVGGMLPSFFLDFCVWGR